MDQPRRLRDPRELTALAHPVRLGIIEQLTVNGPMTATELGDLLEETPANCSWHLRKLAEHGFVEEAAGGTGRRRPWQVSQLGFSWSDEDVTPESATVVNALERMVLERQLDRYHQAREALRQDDSEWREAATANEHASWLTPEELRDLNDEIFALMSRYAGRLVDPAQRPPGSRLCELVAWGVPVVMPGLAATPAPSQAAAATQVDPEPEDAA